MKVKEQSEKVGLNLNIQKTKIMASGPISSWQMDGETMETVTDFIFRGSQITADGDCSHEIKRRLLLGAACSFPGENARSWEALGEARPGQSSLSAGALRYRARSQACSNLTFRISFGA